MMQFALLALVALGSARADAPEGQDAYQRLFPEGSSGASGSGADIEPPAFPAWMFPAGIGFLGLWAATRLRPPEAGGAPSAAMTVVTRTPLGDRSHLLVVDVTGADGERRRLLIGTGTGAPSLVADLGAAPGSETPLLTSGATRPERGSFLDALHAIGAEADDRRDAGNRLDPDDIVSGEVPRARPRGVAAFAAHAETSPRRRTREDAAAHARSLVDEVLAERGSGDPPSSSGHEVAPRRPGLV